MKVSFGSYAHIGSPIFIDGQRYIARGLVDHQKPDGTIIKMMRWESECFDCLFPFEAKSFPLELPQRRRCDIHAAPGRKTRHSKLGALAHA